MIKGEFSDSSTSSGGQDTAELGITLLENIFDHNPNIPAVSTFMLARSESTGNSAGGVFTIGEIVANMTAVQKQPPLPVLSPDQWIVPMDAMIINGKTIPGKSAL